MTSPPAYPVLARLALASALISLAACDSAVPEPPDAPQIPLVQAVVSVQDGRGGSVEVANMVAPAEPLDLSTAWVGDIGDAITTRVVPVSGTWDSNSPAPFVVKIEGCTGGPAHIDLSVYPAPGTPDPLRTGHDPSFRGAVARQACERQTLTLFYLSDLGGTPGLMNVYLPDVDENGQVIPADAPAYTVDMSAHGVSGLPGVTVQDDGTDWPTVNGRVESSHRYTVETEPLEARDLVPFVVSRPRGGFWDVRMGESLLWRTSSSIPGYTSYVFALDRGTTPTLAQ